MHTRLHNVVLNFFKNSSVAEVGNILENTLRFDISMYFWPLNLDHNLIGKSLLFF